MLTSSLSCAWLTLQIDGVGGDGKPSKGEVIYSDDEEEEEENEDGLTEEQVSKKKQRKLAVRPQPESTHLASPGLVCRPPLGTKLARPITPNADLSRPVLLGSLLASDGR